MLPEKVVRFLNRKPHTQNPYPNHSWIWVHCASVGEFEQAIPVLRALKNQKPAIKIYLSFFSESGYDWHWPEGSFDIKCLLPADFKTNYKKIIQSFDFKLMIFMRSDFWPTLLKSTRKIPKVVINAWPNFWHKTNIFKALIGIHLNHSFTLKDPINSHQTKTEHTRFDLMPPLQTLTFAKPLFVFGSIYQKDWEFLKVFINQNSQFCFIIAPHEIDLAQISLWRQDIDRSSRLYTEYSAAEIIFLNTYGDLKGLYGSASLAYVGGGFGQALHSVLEPALANIPVFFSGYNYKKNPEAVTLVKEGLAFPLNHANKLTHYLKTLDLANFKTESKHKISQKVGWSTKIAQFCIDNYL